jgi:hypothetical protein
MHTNQTRINGANTLQFDISDNKEINWRTHIPEPYLGLDTHT